MEEELLAEDLEGTARLLDPGSHPLDPLGSYTLPASTGWQCRKL